MIEAWSHVVEKGSELVCSLVLFYWLLIWCSHLLAIADGCRRLHRRPAKLPPSPDAAEKAEAAPGVTILKPLVGIPLDPNLVTNLESFFNLDYPKYEVRFCIADCDDPCIATVKQLMAKYPNTDATLHVGGSVVGVNPKINNIAKAYAESRYELIMISDAGIMLRPEALQEMVSLMTPDVGIVQQMPFTTDRKGWPATLEKIVFGCHIARSHLYLNVLDKLRLNINCLTGMSFIIRKVVLEHAGGISYFGQYLGEDMFMAAYNQSLGYGMVISSFPAMQNHGVYSVGMLMRRLSRWMKLRSKAAPPILLLEPLQECVALGAAAGVAAGLLLQADPLAFFLFHVLAWMLADWTLLSIMQNGAPPFSKFEFVVTWLFREVTLFCVYLQVLREPHIQWRTKKFIVHWGGTTEMVDAEVTPKEVTTTEVKKKTDVEQTGVSNV